MTTDAQQLAVLTDEERKERKRAWDRRYLEKHRARRRETQRLSRRRHRAEARKLRCAWRSEHPLAYFVHGVVTSAMKRGLLLQPTTCDNCSKEVPVQAHHEDYERPLDIRWLCAECHNRHHLDTPPPPGVLPVLEMIRRENANLRQQLAAAQARVVELEAALNAVATSR